MSKSINMDEPKNIDGTLEKLWETMSCSTDSAIIEMHYCPVCGRKL